MKNKIIVGIINPNELNFEKNIKSKKVVVLDNKYKLENSVSIENINIMRIPEKVNLYDYLEILGKSLCACYNIPHYLRKKFCSFIRELYEENKVFEHEDDSNWVHEHSANITLVDLYNKIVKKEEKIKTLGGNLYEPILNHLCMYKNDASREGQTFCTRKGNSIDFFLNLTNPLNISTRGYLFSSANFLWLVMINTFNKIYKNEGSNNLIFILNECNSFFDLLKDEIEIYKSVELLKDESLKKEIETFNSLFGLLLEETNKNISFYFLVQTTALIPKYIPIKILDSSIIEYKKN